MRSTLCPPAHATSRARFTACWPFTSARSGQGLSLRRDRLFSDCCVGAADSPESQWDDLEFSLQWDDVVLARRDRGSHRSLRCAFGIWRPGDTQCGHGDYLRGSPCRECCGGVRSASTGRRRVQHSLAFCSGYPVGCFGWLSGDLFSPTSLSGLLLGDLRPIIDGNFGL